MTVHGSSLGLVGMTAMVRSGQTGCEGTEWESETSVRCLVGRSASATQRVVMTGGERSGSMSEAYSVDALSVSMAGSSNVVDGGLVTSITVYGGGMGREARMMTAMVRSGQTGCEGTEWESETSVRCLAGHW